MGLCVPIWGLSNATLCAFIQISVQLSGIGFTSYISGFALLLGFVFLVYNFPNHCIYSKFASQMVPIWYFFYHILPRSGYEPTSAELNLLKGPSTDWATPTTSGFVTKKRGPYFRIGCTIVQLNSAAGDFKSSGLTATRCMHYGSTLAWPNGGCKSGLQRSGLTPRVKILRLISGAGKDFPKQYAEEDLRSIWNNSQIMLSRGRCTYLNIS